MCKLELILCLVAINLTSACTPLSIASMAGQTLVKTAVTAHEENQIKAAQNHEIAVANYNVGVEYIRQGNYDKALDRLTRARDAEPGYIPIYNALGVAYQNLGEARNAEESFKRALKLNAKDPDILNNYGQFLCKADRGAEADKYFMQAASDPLYQTPEIPFTNAGICALMNDEQEKAAEYFSKALSLNPGVSAALLQMSEISYDNGNYPAAQDYLNRYLEVTRHTSKSLWLGIRIEHELGDKDAVSSYALLLRNDFPKTEEAKLLKESGLR